MKKIIFFITFAAVLGGCSRGVRFADPLSCTDPFIATCGDDDTDFWNPREDFVPHSAARCTPGALAPLGMVNVGPVTRHIDGPPSGYSAHDTTITGFSFMRTSGSGWWAEFGNLLTMPANGPLNTCYGMSDACAPFKPNKSG